MTHELIPPPFRLDQRQVLESRPRHVDGIDILPWRMFLDQLWAGTYARPQ